MTKRWTPRSLSGTSGAVVTSGHGTFGGYTLRNTGATGASVTFYDNASAASGTILADVDLAAGASETVPYTGGVAFFNGVYASFSAAGVEGSVYVD